MDGTYMRYKNHCTPTNVYVKIINLLLSGNLNESLDSDLKFRMKI